VLLRFHDVGVLQDLRVAKRVEEKRRRAGGRKEKGRAGQRTERTEKTAGQCKALPRTAILVGAADVAASAVRDPGSWHFL
jgi:hypothetical protein